MPRIWATLGNIYRIEAVFGVVGCLLLAYATFQRFQLFGANDYYVRLFAAFVVVGLVLCGLLWLFKPVLVTGGPFIIGPVLRVLVGLGAIVTIFTSVGTFLILFGIVYIFTATPDAYDYAPRAPRQRAPTFKPPSNFAPSARVGPSGAMVYSDDTRATLVGQFESYIPIQVMEQRNGFSRVMAATGQSGWVDARTVSDL